MMTPLKSVKVLVVDDNPLVLEWMARGLEPYCEVITAPDGADALIKVLETPPDLILSDYKMPGLDGRQLFEKVRSRPQSRQIPFIFVASRADIEEKLRPLADGVEEFIAKPFFVAELVRTTKKVVDRIHLEKLAQRASRPGVIQGRLEEMGITDLMQSLEMGQKSCRLTLRGPAGQCEMFFAAGQCKHASSGSLVGDEAVYQAIGWAEGEFEIDFNIAASARTTTTRSTTGLLLEAMRLLDEASRDMVKS